MTHLAGEDGGWKYYEVPRSEFYEELGAVLAEFSDLLLEDPQGARKLDQDPYNDWFYCGYGGDEDSFRVSLWPAYLPVVEAYEEQQIDEAEFRSQCWPKTGMLPVTIHLGAADAVIELAEDELAIQELANSFADFAGIQLVDDWDDTPPAESAPGVPEEPAHE
ncbi:MAG TPA: hypothetical protein VKY74_00870 [Chloroflexia bacterium]|nr:hypothetical protein [Chloroflexia bacterium]